MSGKEKFILYLEEFLEIVVTAILCYGIYRWGAGHDKACFAITLGAIAYLLLCFFNAIFKKSLKSMIQRILSGIMVIVFANELYDYNNLITVFPVFKNVAPTLFAFILLGAVLTILITLKIMIYLYENSDVSSNNGVPASGNGNSNNAGTDSSAIGSARYTKDSNAWLLLYQVFLVVIVGGLVALFTVLYGKGLLKQNVDFLGVVTFLIKYAGSIVMFLLAVVIVLVIFIELFRMIIMRLKVITNTLKTEGQSDTGPLYLLSIIVDFIVCYFTYKFTGIDMNSFVGFVSDGKYMALPLTFLFGGVAFVIFLRLTHATLVLLVDMKPEKVKEYLKEVNNKAEITNRLVEIIKTILDVILDTVITVLKFVKFIPSFFAIVYSFVLEAEEDFRFDEDKDNESDKNSDKNKGNPTGVNLDKDQNKGKKNRSHRTGTAIIRVAAFAFAVVSCYATAEGLSLYVFGPGWQSICISFGIQAILFVLNLKLPAYFNRIGENAIDREKKKYWYGYKRGQEKQTYKLTAGQKILGGFYLAALLSSSFFSFVYICNHVVYDHQSGYADDNTILSSGYRGILNETDDYIREDTKAMQLLASKLLGELKEAYPIAPTSDANVSFKELNDSMSDAQDAYDIAKEEYALAKDDAQAAKDEMDGYQASRNNTTWHNRQDEWQKKFDEAKSAFEALKLVRDQKKNELNAAKTALNDAKKAVNNYKKSQDSVIAEFLLEMLKPSPNTVVLEEDINDMNTMIVELGESGNIVDNYSDLVGMTQTLTVVVKDYIALVEVASNNDDDSVEYLLEHVMDNVVAPDPSSESFSDDVVAWRKEWETKLNTLENVIQHLPKFSENEKDYLADGLIDVELLTNYNTSERMDEIDKLRRDKISDINAIEKAWSLLTGKYKFTAWFSLILALFFDLCSLLAGLFLFWIQKKEVPKS